MEVSKITFREETKQKLANPTLTMAKRTALRRAVIIDYINSKPSGYKFKTSEFNSLAFPKGYRSGNVITFINRMVRDKLITMERIPKSSKYYLTVNDATVTKPGKTAQTAPVEATEPIQVIKGLEVDQLFMNWIEITSNPEHIKGVVEFRKYLKSRDVYLDVAK